jgi:ribonuclease Y
MTEIYSLVLIILSLSLGAVLGYFTRQSLAKRNAKTIEAKIQRMIEKAKEEADLILKEAERKKREGEREILKKESLLSKKEYLLRKKVSEIEKKELELGEEVEKIKREKEEIENLKNEIKEKLEKISGIDKEEAKKEILKEIEEEIKKETTARMRKLEKEGEEKFQKKAREILATVIQRMTLPVVQEITTSTVLLPNEEIKGKIIGKEGRNIKSLENLTGVEIIVDETPEAVTISSFDPIRRQIAKIALEKLIKNGKIQPAKIEEKVEEAKKEIQDEIKEAGEAAAMELGLVGIDPKLLQILGRLKFRTSYGQNVLLHSIEVSLLASALAEEVGANSLVCKKAGLFHDIGKAMDLQVEGSHVDIGIKILEKFGIEKEVINAMKSHHEEYPYESVEAVLVQVADQISGARPGARKDTLENYLKRISELEKIALSFPGVEKAWALQAGREIRVFVRPEEIDDFGARKLAREIANRIQEELNYPGEIKVTVVREMKVIEYAR